MMEVHLEERRGGAEGVEGKVVERWGAVRRGGSHLELLLQLGL